MNDYSAIKNELIETFKKSEEKTHIYFSLETPNGLVVKTCIKEFEIDYDYNDYISISGYEEKDENDYEMVRIPFLNIVSISNQYEGKEHEEGDDYEYCIMYLDKTKLTITIP